MTHASHPPTRSARRDRWPLGALTLIALGIGVLALPASVEGPPLVPISPGHALSLVDAVGVVPLLVGSTSLHYGLWRRRTRLARWVGRRPGAGAAVWFAAGLGLGLLLASAFSTFFWWWAIGALLFVAANAVVVAAASRGRADE